MLDLALTPFVESDLAELVVLQRCCWVQEAILNKTLNIPGATRERRRCPGMDNQAGPFSAFDVKADWWPLSEHDQSATRGRSAA